MAGLTWVGVHPDHRRRGVLRAMFRHHVEQAHREGVAISGLHASGAVAELWRAFRTDLAPVAAIGF